MQDRLTEFLPLFPGPYWHIGADEDLDDYARFAQLLDFARTRYGARANGRDAYLGFINWADTRVRAAGKIARAWNGGIGSGGAVTVRPDVVIEFWIDRGLTPQQHLDGGHLIANESWDPTYSNLFHKTDEIEFREGYENRRLNVTMLYGRRTFCNN